MTLESGVMLPDVRVAYRTWGKLNSSGSNAVVVCHALTGDANVDRWWTNAFGQGRIDTERHFVIASNVLGGCYGTTGPTSVNDVTGLPWGGDFPRVTIRDMVEVQRRLIEHLGVARIALVTGGSMGGMQALEWAVMYPDLVCSIAPISVGAVHSAWCIGISEAQRTAIFADPQWHDGHYRPGHGPTGGFAAARQVGLVSYRSPDSFEAKFGRTEGESGFAVEEYLRYQGEELVGRFDAASYVALTYSMDSHDLGRGRSSVEEVLGAINCHALVIGISSDVLYPVAEQIHLAKLLPGGRYVEIDVPHGHDGFLIEAESVGLILGDFLDEHGCTQAG